MSIIRIEGFDHYDENTAASKLTLGSNSTVDTDAGRGGAGTGALAWTGSVVGYSYVSLGGSYTELFIGFAVLNGSTVTTESELCAFVGGGGGIQFVLNVTPAGNLYVTRGSGSTILGIGSAVLSSSAWNYIEIYATIADSGGNVKVWVNDNLDIDYTGDTKGAVADTDVSSIGFRYGSFRDSLVDDFYALDPNVSPHQTRLGNCKVDTLYPEANGDTNDFTPSAGSNYENVDERPPDDDTTYNQSSAPGDVELYDMDDLAANTEIYALQVSAYARKTDAGSLTVRLGAKVGGAEHWGPDIGLSTDFDYLKRIIEQDPDTGTSWTRSGVNGAQFGVKVADNLTTPAPTTLATTLAPTTLATTPAP